MGRKWGQNVSDYGLGSAGATLAARILGTGELVLYMTNWSGPDWFVYWELSLDTEDAYVLHVGSKVAGHPNFPYGYDVEPDAPV